MSFTCSIIKKSSNGLVEATLPDLGIRLFARWLLAVDFFEEFFGDFLVVEAVNVHSLGEFKWQHLYVGLCSKYALEIA